MSNRRRLILPAGLGNTDGRIESGIEGQTWMLCAYGPCDRDALKRFFATAYHDQPVNPGDTMTWAFCSSTHRDRFVHDTRHEIIAT